MTISPHQQTKSFLSTIEDDLIKLREKLHAVPEVGLHLPQTYSLVKNEFEKLGMEIHESSRVSGFVAILRGDASSSLIPRPLVLLRADMDALPLEEETQLPFASTNGAMHACGHDMHMAGIIGAARALSEVKDELSGDILFFLQPGEEGEDGAQFLIDEGLVEAAGRLPDFAYGLHVWSANYPHGSITSRAGALMASSDVIRLTVKGKGGHGSAPYLAKDPVPIVAEMITQAQVMVAREFNIFDPVVMTCGKVSAGDAPNIIADTAHAEFTLRAFSDEARAELIHKSTELFTHIAQAHEASVDVDLVELYPVTVNDPHQIDFVRASIGKHFPQRWSTLEHPVGAAEDFSKILNRIPGAYIFVSAVPDGVDASTAPYNHSPNAVYDSSALRDCAQILTNLALDRLCSPEVRPSP